MRPKLADYPALELHEEKIFIIVKTYPRPSVKYRELVCTAGITGNGKLIRLYPISYRYLDYQRWYKKYQWIKAKIEKTDLKNDFRVDSYRPLENSIQALGKPVGREDRWLERKKIIFPAIQFTSLEEIKDEYKSDKVSLGIFKPKSMINFIIESDTSHWSKKHQQVLSQLRLFDSQPKTLEKIPFKFSYRFVCNDKRCKKPHKLSIIDWEIFELYRRIKENYQYDMDIILEKIKNKWLDEMWGPKRDSYLIVGTQYPNPTFMVLGVFWPPK